MSGSKWNYRPLPELKNSHRNQVDNGDFVVSLEYNRRLDNRSSTTKGWELCWVWKVNSVRPSQTGAMESGVYTAVVSTGVETTPTSTYLSLAVYTRQTVEGKQTRRGVWETKRKGDMYVRYQTIYGQSLWCIAIRLGCCWPNVHFDTF